MTAEQIASHLAWLESLDSQAVSLDMKSAAQLAAVGLNLGRECHRLRAVVDRQTTVIECADKLVSLIATQTRDGDAPMVVTPEMAFTLGQMAGSLSRSAELSEGEKP